MSVVLARVRIGALAPEHVTVTLRRSDTDEWLDLSTGSNIQLLVEKPSGATETWNCTILGTPTEDELTAYHAYVAGDLDEASTDTVDYKLVAKGTFVTDFGTGPVMFNARTLHVYDTFE